MRRVLPVLLAGMLLALTGCAGEAGGPDPVEEPTMTVPTDGPASPTQGDQPTQADGEELTGTLGGDQQLEGGCAWLDTSRGRYEIAWPEGYGVTFDPLQLTGPDGDVVAEEGDEVTVTGREDSDLMSFCQIGPIFAATAVRAGG